MGTNEKLRAVARKPGDRDPSWGPHKDGLVDFSVLGNQFNPSRQATGASLLADGTVIITAVLIINGAFSFAIARLTEGGELDKSFAPDTDGVTTGVYEDNRNAWGGNTAVLPDGRIIMAGASAQYAGGGGDPQLAFARFLEDGTFDTSLNGNGRLIEKNTDTAVFLGEPAAVKTFEDRSFIVAANYITGPGFRTKTAVLFKYKVNGERDTGFGPDKDGRLEIKLSDPTAPTSISDLHILENGNVLVVGYAQPQGLLKQGLLAMYNANGTPNLPFGDQTTPGMVLMSLRFTDTEFNAVTQRTSNTFVVAGRVGRSFLTLPQGLMYGFDNFGKADKSFNEGQVVETTLRDGRATSWLSADVDHAGRVVTAGGDDGVYVARFNGDGSPDAAFGNDGFVAENTYILALPALVLPCNKNRTLLVVNGIGIDGPFGHAYAYHN